MKYTPMMEQYLAIKKTLPPGTILFFRLGDFYEMFFEDAALASRILDIALTGREGGVEGRVPMCGVPYHAAKSYIRRLVEAGYKVAICEQMEDPRFAKGIVKREVTRIVSQGTFVDEEEGETAANRFLAACVPGPGGACGISYLDLSTGEFKVTEVSNFADLTSELTRIHPVECVLPERVTSETELGRFIDEQFHPSLSHYELRVFDFERAKDLIQSTFGIASIEGLGLKDVKLGVIAAGAILHYLKDHLHKSLEHLKRPEPYFSRAFMILDAMTQRNLEITHSLSGDHSSPTLLSAIDETRTPMGARMLRLWLKRPLLAAGEIQERLSAVKHFVESEKARGSVREAISDIRDLERIVARLNCDLGNARDLVALRGSLARVPMVREVIMAIVDPLIARAGRGLGEFRELLDELNRAIVDQPPLTVKEGGMVKPGYDPELDELRKISKHGKDYIAELQRREIERTGIKSLKIRYNQVFGYYIEVSKANLKSVPADYTRKQTLVNAERFIIPELKEYEEKVLTADERAHEKEYEIFEAFRQKVRAEIQKIQSTAEAIGVLDVLASFAEVAVKRDYVMPEITEEKTIEIEGGRHPVVEMVLPRGEFVENDSILNGDDHQLILITGPNMAGKSTYIRQVALITLLAQVGSFVPAKRARIGVCDRIFTRIGASDHLARGESTFMVEMIETANILNNATSRSLIIMDEIGRGTSTFDGISIAWSVCEYLVRSEGPRPRALFATHYHELTELEELFPGIKNYNVTVFEGDHEIIFLRKIVRGGTDKSYGIHVAKLAGVPESVITRAREILAELEQERVKEGREVL